MKIALLIKDLTQGGAERATADLSSWFASQGNDVTIITLRDCERFFDTDGAVKFATPDFGSLDGLNRFRRFFAMLGRAFALRRCVRKISPEILVGIGNIMSSYAVFSALFTKVKVVGTERSNPFKHMSSLPFSLLRRLTGLLADGYVFQTRGAQSFFPKSVRKKSAVITNAVLNDYLLNFTRPEVPEKVICSAGRLVRLKRFDVLIDAFSTIANKFPDYRLEIFGQGDEHEKLESLIESRSVSGRVLLPGALPDAYTAVSRASVFAFTSEYEGMPNALIEAMVCGVPCVAADCDFGPRELIVDGENGLLVPVGDVAATAGAIERILSDRSLALRLSENAKALRQRHSMSNVGGQWLDYFYSLTE